VAYAALVAVAENGAGYGWRAAHFGGMALPLLRPTVGGTFGFASPDKCRRRGASAPPNASVGCCSAVNVSAPARGAAALRSPRLAAVDTVLAPTVTDPQEVCGWMARLDALLAPAVTFTPVGLGVEVGRAAIKQALGSPHSRSVGGASTGRQVW